MLVAIHMPDTSVRALRLRLPSPLPLRVAHVMARPGMLLDLAPVSRKARRGAPGSAWLRSHAVAVATNNAFTFDCSPERHAIATDVATLN